MNASALPFATISGIWMVPPNSWTAAYFTSPDDAALPMVVVSVCEAEEWMEARSLPERTFSMLLRDARILLKHVHDEAWHRADRERRGFLSAKRTRLLPDASLVRIALANPFQRRLGEIGGDVTVADEHRRTGIGRSEDVA